MDWSVLTTAGETVEANTNQFLQNPPQSALSSSSTLRTHAQATTYTSKFDFDGNVNYRQYYGPAAEDMRIPYNLYWGLKGNYEIYGKDRNDRTYVGIDYTSQSTAFALLNELGILLPVTGALNRLTFRGGLSRTVSHTDSFNIDASSTQTSYDPSGGGIPFTDTYVGGTWRHRLSPQASVSATSSAELLDYDNVSKSSIMLLKEQAGFDVTLSPLLSLRANGGIAYAEANNVTGTVASTIFTNTAANGSNSRLEWLADVLLTYKLLKNTTFTLAASQTVGPTLVGSLLKSDNISAVVSHTINSRSSVSFSLSAYKTTTTYSASYASASVAYSYQLAKDWQAQVIYRHLHRFSSAASSIVNTTTGAPIVTGLPLADSDSLMVVVSMSDLWMGKTQGIPSLPFTR